MPVTKCRLCGRLCGEKAGRDRAARIPARYIGRMLSREEAAELLDKIERGGKGR
jgi:hypothetical protein